MFSWPAVACAKKALMESKVQFVELLLLVIFGIILRVDWQGCAEQEFQAFVRQLRIYMDCRA
jgi:hypothetical protein